MTTLKNIGSKVTGVFNRSNGKRSRSEEIMMSGTEEVEDDVDASEFEEEEEKKVKTKSRRPKETRFTQQRIAAWNPVLTPRLVVPVFLVLMVIFLIFGGVMLREARIGDEVYIYYQDCDTSAPTSGFEDIPDDHFQYSFHKLGENEELTQAQWKYVADSSADADAPQSGTCQIRFTIPYELSGPTNVFYRIENFYGNHRRYVLSYSEDQLNGEDASLSVVKDTVGFNCKPLVTNSEGKIYYPCGLIANAMFNDTYPDSLTIVSSDATDNTTFSLSDENINWSSDKARFKKTKYSASDIVPPPYWQQRYPDGYNDTNVPDIETWEEFQNWMRTPAFPEFSRLIRRSDSALYEGEYQIDIELNWPVTIYNGKKAVYITHGSNGIGRNNFLGVAYLVGGAISFFVALITLLSHFLWGRAVGDTRLLSWNK